MMIFSPDRHEIRTWRKLEPKDWLIKLKKISVDLKGTLQNVYHFIKNTVVSNSFVTFYIYIQCQTVWRDANNAKVSLHAKFEVYHCSLYQVSRDNFVSYIYVNILACSAENKLLYAAMPKGGQCTLRVYVFWWLYVCMWLEGWNLPQGIKI